MPNYRKSFNFRNGVQVDEDNFVVNPVGLVGIGTTVPTEVLDVFGNVKISGILSASQLYVDTITNTSGSEFNEINIGETFISSGIITASSQSGIVTYYGDGGNLINLPTSQWIDVDSGLGYTSIYAAGFVGVQTNYPFFPFQVGSNPLTAQGVGIGSDGNIVISGILTVRSYVGFGSGITEINANNIATGTISTNRLPIIPNDKLSQDVDVSGIITARNQFRGNLVGNVNSSGVSTFSGTLLGNLTGNVNSSGVSTFSGTLLGNLTGNVNSSGVSTFSGGISGNVTGNLTGNVNSSGVSTFSGGISGNVTGNLVGIASTARDLTSNARVSIDNITAQTSQVGVSTVSSRLRISGLVGVNTDSPQSDIHILNNADGRLQVTGQQSFVLAGTQLNPSQNSGGIKYGNNLGLYPYSTPNSLDIINYGTGNINFYLNYSFNPIGLGTGNYNWFDGLDRVNPLMSLTYEGNLGLGVTNPTNKLEVDGDISSKSLNASENIFAVGAGSSISTNSVYILNGVSGVLDANGNQLIFPSGTTNTYVTSGISTFYDIEVANNGIFYGRIGLGNENPRGEIDIGDYLGDISNSILITSSGIGLGTDLTDSEFFLDGATKKAGFGAIAIGSTADKVVAGTNDVFYVKGKSEFDGSVGIGTTVPSSTLTVNGDIRAGFGNTTGVILTAPNGNIYRITVGNTGTLTTVLVT